MGILSPQITSIFPARAIEGGRVTLRGRGFDTTGPVLPDVRVGPLRAQVVYASPTELTVLVPPKSEGGTATVEVAGVATAELLVGAPFATGLHQVDNPVFDDDGNLYVTYSGTRGQQVPVSIFRVRPNGTRETFSSGIVNPTSMAFGPDGRLYVSSRFEGTVYRLGPDGSYEPFASDLGVACGLAFAADGTLFVGDRSGTVFRVTSDGHATAFATLPASVAAFHIAFGREGALYVSAPTLAAYDPVYRIDADGTVTTRYDRFGRPQGVAFDRAGTLYVVEALAGMSGVYRLPEGRDPELVVSGSALVGVAFDRAGTMVVCSNDTAYRWTAP